MEKKIKEITFGAKDSELYKFEYTIPEGYEAEIKDGKVIVKKKESEDERIRKTLIHIVKGACDKYGIKYIGDEIGQEKLLAYLEKQKENPKSADSIPSDCTSDAKYEGRWHNVKDSLPDSTREVLCKDAIGNYFIGRYYSKGVWEVSMYDDCDKSNEDNPPVVMWIDIPSEKQKEQKWSPSEREMGVLYKLCYISNQITGEDDAELTRLYQDLKREYFNGHSFENMFLNEKQKDKVVESDHDREQQPAEEDGPFDEDKFLEGELAAFLQNYDKEYDDDAAVSDVAIHFYELGKKMKQQPAEWSEEDEAAYNAFICEVINEKMNPTIEQIKWLRSICDRLKSLRPQPKQEWSEEFLRLMGITISQDGNQVCVLLGENLAEGIAGFGDTLADAVEEFKKEWRQFDRFRKATWEPSEEQMKEYIYWYKNFIKSGLASPSSKAVTVLGELLEQLKKL